MESTRIVERSTFPAPAVGRRARAWRLGIAALVATCAPAVAGDLVPSKDCAAGKCAQLRIDENFQVSRQILSGVPVEQAEWPAPAAPVPAIQASAVSGSAGANPLLVAALAAAGGMLLQFLLQSAAARRRKPAALATQRPPPAAASAPVNKVVAMEAPAPVQAPAPVAMAFEPEPAAALLPQAVAADPQPGPVEIVVPAESTVASEAESEALAPAPAVALPESPGMEVDGAGGPGDANFPPIEIAWTDSAGTGSAVPIEVTADVTESSAAIEIPVAEEDGAAAIEPSPEVALAQVETAACEIAQDLPVDKTAAESGEISASIAAPIAELASSVAEMTAAEAGAAEIAAPAQSASEPEPAPDPIRLAATPEPVAEAVAEPAPAPAQPEPARAAAAPHEEQTVALLRRLSIQRSRTAADERHATVFRLITQGQFVRAERVLLELESPPDEAVIPSWSVTTAEHISLKRERELQQKLDGLRERVSSDPARRRLAVADAHLRRSRLDEAAEALEELEDEVLGG